MVFFGVCAVKPIYCQLVNDYKYVLVPEKFKFLTDRDQYQLNSLTGFLFEKYGFKVLMENENFPDDLLANRCSALHADVLSSSGGFSFVTKIQVVLKNCNQEVVFQSKIGRSKLKDWKFAYQEALRDAFSSVKALEYSYQKPQKSVSPQATTILPKTIFANNKLLKVGVNFEKEGEVFTLKKHENGFLLSKQKSLDTLAQLNANSHGSFIYTSKELNGTAYFDEQGNLIVEYFDKIKSKVQQMIFFRKD